MSRRLTITIEDNITDVDALQLVTQVVANGKISCGGNYYCYATSFRHPNYKDQELMVHTSTRTKEPNAAFIVETKSEKKS